MRVAAVLVALATTSAACGARLSDRQIQAVSGGASGTGAAGATTGAVDGGTGDAGTTGDTAAGTGDATGGTGDGGAAGSSAGTGGAATGAGATTGSTGATGGAATGAAPPGGNGGATDTGVTATELRLGTVVTLTGPVPGLFRGAVIGAQAWAAYQNSQGGLFGRRIRIVTGDDKLSADENRAQIIRLQQQVFAFLGSFSTFDDAGAAEMRKSNVPDVGYSLSVQRSALPNNFSPQPLPPGWREGSLNYFKQTYPEAVKKVGALVVNVDAPRRTWTGEKAAMQKAGYEIVYERFVQPTETDFTADVVQMCNNRGVQMVVVVSDAPSMARIAKAIQQQNCKDKIKVPNYGANAYDPRFLQQAGSAADGALIDMQLSLYGGEDGGAIPEVALLNQWVKRVDPSFVPDIFTAFAWASGRLFAQAHQAAGPKITRASLLEQLKKIDDFDSNGLVAPAGPASKRPPTCWLLVKVQGGKFVRATPDRGFRCNDGGYFRL